MKQILATLALALAATAASAQDHGHHHAPPPPGDAQIVVTINAEARVSALPAAPMPRPVACEEVVELKVKVVNQGFVTAPLRARLVEDSDRYAALHMDAAKLSGEPEEVRLLHLIPLGKAPVDVTVAFSINNMVGDLGGRDRVHLLLRCDTAAAASTG